MFFPGLTVLKTCNCQNITDDKIIHLNAGNKFLPPSVRAHRGGDKHVQPGGAKNHYRTLPAQMNFLPRPAAKTYRLPLDRVLTCAPKAFTECFARGNSFFVTQVVR